MDELGARREPRRSEGAKTSRGQLEEFGVSFGSVLFEPQKRRLDQPREHHVGSPLVNDLVAHVEGREFTHDADRRRAQLGGVRRELWLVRGVTPEKSEGRRLLTCDSEQNARSEPSTVARVQRKSEFLTQSIKDLLEDLAIEHLLGVEVPVDNQFCDTTGGRDIIHRGVREAGRREGVGRTPQNRGSTLGPGK